MLLSAFLPYIVVYSVAVIMMAISMLFYDKERVSTFFFWIAWIALFTFVGLRDSSVGTDTIHYLSSTTAPSFCSSPPSSG